MIYYPVKSTSCPNPHREREKIKCELLLWLFPLMSTLFLFFLSNPTLGSRASRVSILSSDLVKPDHTATRSLTSPRWPAKAPQPPSSNRSCTRPHIHARTHTWTHVHITTGLFCTSSKQHLSWQDTARVCFIRTSGKTGEIKWKNCGWDYNESRGKTSKWGLSLTELLEDSDLVLWFVTTPFQLSHWETFKHTYKRRSCGERLSAYLFGEWSKWFPPPTPPSQTLNC